MGIEGIEDTATKYLNPGLDLTSGKTSFLKEESTHGMLSHKTPSTQIQQMNSRTALTN
jgi:hypothetical protein